ncbi:ArsR/SmtB family transcription factor [Thiomicrorhabdus xiamenensis]|uniref:Helix-turn-helix transcriptional regulator n=1 Tax=Thiomicrorhabdus xiamenensis TaxID=2739063 RepID=A0A7D4SSY2_9GAMM|nr:metalloregulator ArsR/SmtB family transcription factor [Thiomicrorhabdus xiamenensis]QKI89963.1 helix-turn-helix transcriptional regulator [Thiomicrorhabdus xiamenensis]
MTLETVTQTFKALSEPVRLRIVHLLLQRESLCVCDLVETLELNQSTVSRHLAYLKNSGLVTSWRDGTWMHYALIPETLQILNLEVLKRHLSEQLSLDLQKLQAYEQKPRSCNL